MGDIACFSQQQEQWIGERKGDKWPCLPWLTGQCSLGGGGHWGLRSELWIWPYLFLGLGCGEWGPADRCACTPPPVAELLLSVIPYCLSELVSLSQTGTEMHTTGWTEGLFTVKLEMLFLWLAPVKPEICLTKTSSTILRQIWSKL